MAEVPLRRNRDFLLLQAGQLLSATGSQSALVAYPLLVLAATGSPALAGLVERWPRSGSACSVVSRSTGSTAGC